VEYLFSAVDDFSKNFQLQKNEKMNEPVFPNIMSENTF